MVDVTFWGVRGSTPCPCDANRRYGGNTACVAVEADGQDPLLFDLGTGLRFYGDTVAAGSPYRVLSLVTHLHWDHVQGLPFFGPIHRPETHLTVAGQADGADLRQAFDDFMRPPYFPVRPTDLIGDLDFLDVAAGDKLTWGRATILAADVPHTGPTLGYRLELDGVVVAYISDHQQPADDQAVAESVLALCDGADLVIHDAQYEQHEFEAKSTWGHCTIGYAVRVAAQAGAKRLALFHHDPSHDDEVVDRLLAEARAEAAGTPLLEVFAAAEGLTVSLAEGSRSPVSV